MDDQRMTDRHGESRDAGMTFVDLLALLVVVGVIATVVTFVARAVIDARQPSRCAAEYETVQDAISAHVDRTRSYPPNGASADLDPGLVPADMPQPSRHYNVGPMGTIVLDSRNDGVCAAPPE